MSKRSLYRDEKERSTGEILRIGGRAVLQIVVCSIVFRTGDEKLQTRAHQTLSVCMRPLICKLIV